MHLSQIYFTSYHIFSLHNVSEEYVYHPINALHLIGRIDSFLSKINLNKDLEETFQDTFDHNRIYQLAAARGRDNLRII